MFVTVSRLNSPRRLHDRHLAPAPVYMLYTIGRLLPLSAHAGQGGCWARTDRPNLRLGLRRRDQSIFEQAALGILSRL
jgi:hypothetical protein